MEVAAQTVVVAIRVSVVAGIVYVPGVGYVATAGTGTTGPGWYEEVEDADEEDADRVSSSWDHDAEDGTDEEDKADAEAG